MSVLGLEDEESSSEIIKVTPTSLPCGPVTQLGGQKDLKPSMFVVSAISCVVSVFFPCLCSGCAPFVCLFRFLAPPFSASLAFLDSF